MISLSVVTMLILPSRATEWKLRSRKWQTGSRETAAEAEVIDILEHSLKTAVGLIVFDEDKPEYAGYIKSKNQKSLRKSTSRSHLWY